MKQLKAFHGDQKIKDKYVNRVRSHREADELIHGVYWEGGKGCAVGCTIHSNRHSAYETELGIPEVIARMEDFLFERMKNGQSKQWPENFLNAIPVGADLSHVHGKFFAWTLLDEQTGFWKVWKSKEDQQVFKDFGNFIAFLATDQPFNKTEWESVRHPFIASLDRLDSLASLARLARLASLARLARLARLDRLDRLASLASLASLARLDSLDRLDRLASLARLARLDRLDSLAGLDVYKIASEKLLSLLSEAKEGK